MSNRRSMTDFPRNEAGLVDEFIGTAYDVVKGVYVALPELRELYEIAESIPGLGEAAVEAALAEAMPPVRTELATAVALANAWAESPTPPNPADPSTKSAKSWAAEAEISVGKINKTNVQYPFTYVDGITQYDVGVISGDPSANTSGLALWVEGAIEYDFTINDAKRFTLNSPGEYLDGTKMRIIINARFDDIISNFTGLQNGFAQEFNESQLERAEAYEDEKGVRTEDYFEYLAGLTLELSVPYAPFLVLDRPTQTVTRLGVLYRPRAEFLPIQTSDWATDESKFAVANDMALRQEMATPTGSKLSGDQRTAIVKRSETVADKLNTLPLGAWENMPSGMVYAPTSDPATWPDISLSFSISIATLAAGVGGTFDLPHGNYRCGTSFANFPKNVIVKANHSTIYFYGTGLFLGMDAGIGAGGGFENCIIRGTGAPDQDGVYFQGSMPSLKKFYVQDFGGTSVRIGNVTVAGAQWADCNQIHIWNQAGQTGGVSGDIALMVDGAATGLNPNSNLNVLDNIMISGGFNTMLLDKGVGNKYRNLNLACRVAAGKTLMRLEGSATEIQSYVESADGTLPDKVVNMTSTSSRIYAPRNDFVLSPGVGRSMDSLITDDGYGNVFNVVPRGKDASGTGSNNNPGGNLFANSQFKVWNSATTPTGGRSASATITKGTTGYTGGRSVQFNDVASNSSLSFDITPSGSSIINLALEYLKGKTMTVGIWVTSNYPGPMIKIFAESGNTASSGEHTGNGLPQFLCATIKVGAAATAVFAQLRSNNAGGGVNTGTANFTGMVLVFGNEIPKNSIPCIPETGGTITGDLHFKYDAVTFADSALENKGSFYVWTDSTGRSRKSATRPTVRDSGESTLYPIIVGSLECSGPFKPGLYTLATLPSVGAYNGYLIIVTDATGGAKLCRSNGTFWQLINTTTNVS